jgi:hypothetical protein
LIKDAKKRIATAMGASGTTLLELFGVGPVVACMLVGGTRDVPTEWIRVAASDGSV